MVLAHIGKEYRASNGCKISVYFYIYIPAFFHPMTTALLPAGLLAKPLALLRRCNLYVNPHDEMIVVAEPC